MTLCGHLQVDIVVKGLVLLLLLAFARSLLGVSSNTLPMAARLGAVLHTVLLTVLSPSVPFLLAAPWVLCLPTANMGSCVQVAMFVGAAALAYYVYVNFFNTGSTPKGSQRQQSVFGRCVLMCSQPPLVVWCNGV